jgi:hypothetical protein
VYEKDSPRGAGKRGVAVPPVAGVWVRQFDLGPDGFEHFVEQLVFAWDVAVERHRGDAELAGDAAEADRLEPFCVTDCQARPR